MKISNDSALFSHHPVWAWHPGRSEHQAGYTYFRRKIICPKEVPYHFAVSADNRFTFYLDGKVLGRGPLRGDLDHYCYDEYEGILSAGEHILAAEVAVWSPAWRISAAPWPEMHAGGGFMIAGYAGDERMELPDNWLTCIDPGRRPLQWNEAWTNGPRIPAPPMDEVKFSLYKFDWNKVDRPSGEWVTPVVKGFAVFRDTYQTDPDTPWNLLKRPLKAMTETPTAIAKILTGPESIALCDGKLTGSCHAGKHLIQLDLGKNQTFMVHFAGSAGRGYCRMAYAETLFDSETHLRRHHAPGFVGENGYADKLYFAGKAWQYDSFWYRTARFIELELDLQEDLTDISLALDFITYPLGPFREFHAPHDPVLEEIYKTACHTLSCCAHEQFEDCPYYEQLQYAGDSRIEALVSYAVSGKDDLGRYMLHTIAYSQLGSGLTQSRYPSVFKQVIPGYSLIWALALHDHYVIFGDLALVKELLHQVEYMLSAFERARTEEGLIGPLPGWHFTDWVDAWRTGASDRGENVPETILNLFYAEACLRVAQLEQAVQQPGKAEELLARREKTLSAVNKYCYDPQKKRYMDAPGHPDWLSLHANTLAILFGAVPEKECPDFLREISQDGSLKQMSLYFSFYLLSAIMKYGTQEELRKQYDPWENMLQNGSTTFPEKPGNCRSECHAWSCAPAWFLLRSANRILFSNPIPCNI